MSLVDRIASLSKTITEEERNRNGLLELVQYLQSDDSDVLEAALTAVGDVYSHITSKGSSWILLLIKLEGVASGDVIHEYHYWMRKVYGACQEEVLHLLLHPQQSVAALALEVLLMMVAWEGHAHQLEKKAYSFPNSLFHVVVSRLLDNALDGEALISRCDPSLSYHDVLFHWLRNIASIVDTKLSSKGCVPVTEYFIENVYAALQLVTMPTHQTHLKNFLAGTPPEVSDVAPPTKNKTRSLVRVEGLRILQKYRKQFSDAWLAFLRLPLQPRLLRHILVDLHARVMPHLLDPRLLLDFLTSAYDCGGVVSLLALNGLFLLMNKYHLDYPSFYPQLYQLLDSSVFYVKFTSRFFRLLDTFLSSTHLPLYLVAAFAKKLTRLSLTAPPHGVVLAVVMVINITKRHPNCRVLLHRTHMEECTLTSDPYDLDEPDPAACHALESSFWELKTLSEHFNPEVADTIKQILEPDVLTSSLETSLEEHLSSEDRYKVIDFESHYEEVALNYKEPLSLWQQGPTNDITTT